jgi:hypothetical protein
MANHPDNDRGRDRAGTSPAVKLLHAAALAAALVPLGTVVSEGATITCVTSAASGGCSASGSYSPSGPTSNTWKFFADFNLTDLIYTFEISGTPTATFDLDVRDVVTTQGALESDESNPLGAFPGFTCIPTFDEGQCGLFDVFGGEAAEWADGYVVTITWFTNPDPLSQPPDDGRNVILHAPDASGGIVFTEVLEDIAYDPEPSPTDPGISGRGDSFSRFGAFRQTSVPEPSSLLLLGVGALGAFARRRWRRG